MEANPASDSWFLQACIGAGLFVATAVGALIQRGRGKRELAVQERTKHVVLESASIADMAPMRAASAAIQEMSVDIKALRADMHSLLKVVSESIENREQDEEVERLAVIRAKELLAEKMEESRRNRPRPKPRPRP